MYQEFGTTLKENEPNILFSAARSYVVKCAGIVFDSEIQNLSLSFEIKRIVKDFIAKGTLELFYNSKVKEVLE
jgi:hypothetical protein